MNFQKSPLCTLLALLAVLALVASACGDDGTDATDDPPAALEAEPATEPAADEEPITEAVPDEEPATEAVPDEEPATEPAGDSAAGATTTGTGETVEGSYLGSYELADDEFGTMVAVTVAGGTRTIVSNALPDHETGEFPNDGNPNEIMAQDLTWEFPTEPVLTGSSIDARTVGVAVNGVKFEPGTGESVTCDSGEQYRIEALQDTYNLGLDFNNAHVQPGGEYHYHGISEMLVGAYDNSDDLVHVGFAADGFLMFYSKSGAYAPSYQLRSGTRSGADCVATGPNDPSVEIEGTTADGVYVSDWEFTEGSGDLDSCNGISIDGEYMYIITDTYPFVSRCLNGEFTSDLAGAGGQGRGGQAGGGAPSPPDIAEIAAELGVDEDTLTEALGSPPYDLAAAAEALGILIEELQAVFPRTPGA